MIPASIGSAAARLLVVVTGLLALLVLAGPVRAHVGGGAAGSNYDGAVTSVTPDLPDVEVRVLSFGDEFEVVNRGPDEVLVPGYSDEPYLRIGPDGVWRNRNSPATYINLDRFGRVELPGHASVQADPEWERVSSEPAYVWHDHRTHFMSENALPPMVAAAPDRSHTVFAWTVPLVHADREVAVQGVLTWDPPPSPWTVWPAYAAVALLGVAAGLLARGPRPLGLLLLAGAAAALWHAAATPAPPESIGSHVGALASALLPAVTTAVVAGLGWHAARRGRGSMTGLLAITTGWLLLVQGLPDVDFLWTANVLSTGPGLLAQVAVAVLITLGVGLVGGGVAAVRRFRETSAVPAA